jgi:hypothetical protein
MAEQHQTQEQQKAGEPYCGNCGYVLSGLVDSSKCPECGKPLVEVLNRFGRWGRRYQSQTRLFGLPIVSYAYGPVPGEKVGHAKGVFAFGDRATGFVAVGGFARGLVAVGGFAIGGITLGGFSFGLFGALGGVAIGALTYGGVSIGGVGAGGLVVALLAVGGMAIGYAAAGGFPVGVYTAGPGGNDAEAIELLHLFSWFLGPPSFSLMNMLQPILVILGVAIGVAAILALLCSIAHMRQSRATTT